MTGASDTPCGFCGQPHVPPQPIVVGDHAVPVGTCENLPPSWAVVGPDVHDAVVIIDRHGTAGQHR